MRKLSDRIKKRVIVLREEAHLSQPEIADVLLISQWSVSTILAGRNNGKETRQSDKVSSQGI